MKLTELCVGFLAACGLVMNAEAGCDSYCVQPFCECKGWWIFKYNSCRDGYSGPECRCAFSRTNVADNSLVIPDSMTTSLVLEKTADGQSILSGSFKSGYIASAFGKPEFSNVRGSDTENVWSMAKTSSGAILMGTPDSIFRRAAGASTDNIQKVYVGDGIQGGIQEFDGALFAGSFNGLKISNDDGLTWGDAPCTGSIGLPLYTGYEGTDEQVLPPADARLRCTGQVTKMLVNGGKLYVFYAGYGGGHMLSSADGEWEQMPQFSQDGTESADCGQGFCHVLDADVLDNTMFVSLMGQSVLKVNLASADAKWEKVFISESKQNIGAEGVTVTQGRVFVTGPDGLHFSKNGVNWVYVDKEHCPAGRGRPPFFSRAATATDTHLVVGTSYGPWVFKLESIAGFESSSIYIESAAGSVAAGFGVSAVALGTAFAVIRRRRNQSESEEPVPEGNEVVSANPMFQEP